MIEDQYGEVDWSNQACDIVRVGLHKFITQFGSSSAPVRSCSFKMGGRYTMPARSAQEIEEDISRGGAQPVQGDLGNATVRRQHDDNSLPWM
jgi:hypothetical protein